MRSAQPPAILFCAALSALFGSGCGSPSAPTIERCALARPTLQTGRLTTDGPRLRDELGRLVFLRGFDGGSRAKWSPYAPFDFASDGDYPTALAAYLRTATNLGADVLRLPFTWAAVEPTMGTDDTDYLGRYEQLIDGAWKLGIRSIVDFHQDVYAENFCGDGFPAWTLPANPPAPHHDCPTWFDAYSTAPVMAAFDAFWAADSTVQPLYVNLWQRMIAREKDRAGVIAFEPFNEPSAGSADEATFERTTLTAFEQKMATLINGLAPQLVFVEPPGVASATFTTTLGKIQGTNIVYAPHYYQPTTIYGGTGREDLVQSELQQVMATGVAWNVPVFIGEWGAGQAASDAADYVAAHHAAFDALALSATQWEYSAASEKWNDEPLDIAAADGTPLPLTNGMLRPHAHAVAGAIVAMSFDTDTNVFTLRYTPEAGNSAITEIIVPPLATTASMTLGGACVDDSDKSLLLTRPDSAGEVDLTITMAAKLAN